MRTLFLSAAPAALALAACNTQTGPIEQSYGPNPVLPEPSQSLLPTVNVADAAGWSAGERPVAADGLEVGRFADGLDHPRWMHVLPNGDVLVAESSSEPGGGGGLIGWFQNRIMRKAGAVEEESPDRIVLLRDADGDGAAETRSVFLETGLNQPFGMALLDGYLYVGNTDALVRVPYADGQMQAEGAPERVAALPYNAENNGHWTRNVIAAPGDGLFVAVGSVSNVGEAGMAVEEDRAAIHRVDPATGAMTLYASGLRNPNGMDVEPVTGALWTAVNERDELGDNLVPDYMTSVREGGFYGWPWVYYGTHPDPRFDADERPEGALERAIAPDYALGAHTASLGLVFYDGGLLGPDWAGGAFVGQHGSWNRSEPSGYKVIFVPFEGGAPAGPPVDVLTGFIDPEAGEAMGRPVGVAVAQDGALLVADDVGDVIWRVAPAD